jgi:signal transduction histidine kinase
MNEMHYRYSPIIYSLRIFILAGFQFLLITITYGQVIDSLQTQLRATQHDSIRLRLYSEIIELYYWNSQYDSMQVYNQTLYTLSKQIYSNSSNEYAALYFHRSGLYYRAKGMFAESLQALNKGLRISRQINDQSRISKILYALSVVYADQGDTKKAIEQLLSNLSYYEKRKLTDMILNTYTVLVTVYEKLENRKLSHYYIDQYLRLIKEVNDPQKLFVGYSLKADLYKEHNAYRLERRYRQLSLRLARQLKQPDQLIYALNGLAANLRKDNQPGLAIRYLKEAIELSREMSEGKSYALGVTWQEFARVELQLGHTGEALRAAKLAVAATRAGGRPDAVVESLSTLAMVQETNGNYEAALKIYKVHRALSDSLFNLEKNEKIAQVQAHYDLKNKENAILLLNKDIQFERLKAKEQDLQHLMLKLSIVILVLVVGIISYFLRRFYLTQKVLARQKQEIENRTVELVATNSMKDKIFSILSHDLRSPVASLKASFTLMKVKNRLPSELNGLEREVNGLSHTLDNILYWALMQQSGLRIRRQQVELSDLVNEVLGSFTGLIQSKQLIVVFDSVLVAVWLDENLVVLVLRNILHNAIKFTGSGGRIQISILEKSSETYLFIADTGVGMDLRNQTVDQPVHGYGTGLGLGLSEELMQLMGGRLTIESEIGRGTTISLSWPSPAVSN